MVPFSDGTIPASLLVTDDENGKVLSGNLVDQLLYKRIFLYFNIKSCWLCYRLLISLAFSPRWLTDLVVNTGVESLECVVQCKGDVTTILKQGDLLNLCEKVLRVSQWGCERNKRIRF